MAGLGLGGDSRKQRIDSASVTLALVWWLAPAAIEAGNAISAHK
jgi:hypothetical protein